MNQERKKSGIRYGHDENEWSLEDYSENKEWEEYYESKIRKWRNENHDG